MLGPVALVAWWRGRKHGKRSKADIWIVLLVVFVGVSIGLAACSEGKVCTNTHTPPTSTSTGQSTRESRATSTQQSTATAIPPTPTTTPTPVPTNDSGGTSTIIKTAYLTFDDGPAPATEAVSAYLQGEGVEATFFLIEADPNPDFDHPSYRFSKTIGIDIGINAKFHAVGIHGFMHPYGKGPNDEADPVPFLAWNHSYFLPSEGNKGYLYTLENEISNLEAIVGPLPDLLLRAPGGHFPSVQFPGSKFEKAYYYGWDAVSPAGESGVGEAPTKIVEGLISRVKEAEGKIIKCTEGLECGVIILMHPSIHPGDYNAIMAYNLVDALRDIGYTQFKKLPRDDDAPGYPVIGVAQGWE